VNNQMILYRMILYWCKYDQIGNDWIMVQRIMRYWVKYDRLILCLGLRSEVISCFCEMRLFGASCEATSELDDVQKNLAGLAPC
jgi:hypothetical protein